MIPRICANCANGINITSGEQVAATICNAIPIQITKQPTEICGMFKMSESPVYVVNDENKGNVQEESNLPSDAVSEVERHAD